LQREALSLTRLLQRGQDFFAIPIGWHCPSKSDACRSPGAVGASPAPGAGSRNSVRRAVVAIGGTLVGVGLLLTLFGSAIVGLPIAAIGGIVLIVFAARL